MKFMISKLTYFPNGSKTDVRKKIFSKNLKVSELRSEFEYTL